MRLSNTLRLAARVARRPRLLLLLLATTWRFRRRGWYRQRPFLPLPPARYTSWRLHTAFGEERSLPTPDELEAYLRWTARMRARKRKR